MLKDLLVVTNIIKMVSLNYETIPNVTLMVDMVFITQSIEFLF